MIYMRGHRDNYDAWRDAGNDGWGYADVLPYFKRSENNSRGADAYHGVERPARRDRRRRQRDERAPRAGVDAGPRRAREPRLQRRRAGRGRAAIRPRSGRASVAARRSRFSRRRGRDPNLTVHSGALVTSIVFEKAAARWACATGAAAASWSRAPEREVLLSAGAIGSPHLMLLSGVGPADELRADGDPGRGRRAGRRQEPAGPPAGLRRLSRQGRHHRRRHARQPGRLARSLSSHAPRAPRLERRRERRLRPDAQRRAAPEPAVSFPAGRQRPGMFDKEVFAPKRARVLPAAHAPLSGEPRRDQAPESKPAPTRRPSIRSTSPRPRTSTSSSTA